MIMNRYFIIVGTVFISFILWESKILFPLKMLAVLIHEFWHSLIAIFFNVDWVQFHIYADESGKTIVKGNLPLINFIIVTSSGYIGTSFTACLFLRNFLKKELEDFYFFLFCFILFIISFVLVPSGSLTFFISFIWSIGLIVFYFFNKEIAFSIFTGIQSFILFYSFYDLLDFSKNPFQSDIGILYYFLYNRGIYKGNINQFIYFISFIWIVIILYIFYKFIISLIFEHESKDNAEPITQEINPEQDKENSLIENINSSATNTNELKENTNIKIPDEEEIEKIYKNNI